MSAGVAEGGGGREDAVFNRRKGRVNGLARSRLVVSQIDLFWKTGTQVTNAEASMANPRYGNM